MEDPPPLDEVPSAAVVKKLKLFHQSVCEAWDENDPRTVSGQGLDGSKMARNGVRMHTMPAERCFSNFKATDSRQPNILVGTQQGIFLVKHGDPAARLTVQNSLPEVSMELPTSLSL